MCYSSALSKLVDSILILLILTLTACSRAATPTPTAMPTIAVTDTTVPTNTPAPTSTLNSTDTPNPTLTPLPSTLTLVWTSIGLEGQPISALAVDPATPTTLYAGTHGGGVFKSINSGTSWNAVNTGLTDTDVRALAIDPATPTTVYAGTLGSGVFKSTDGGANWTAVNTAWVLALAIDPATPTTLYAGTVGDGVLKSTNGGGDWNAVNTGLPNKWGVYASHPLTTWAYAVVIDPVTPTTLYAITDGALFRSTNGGANWSGVKTGLLNVQVHTLAIDPATPTILYAGTSGHGVIKSVNGGASWNPVNIGLTDTDVRALAIDPATPTTVYAGTKGGVFKSADGGTNWTAVNTSPSASLLAINPVVPTILYSITPLSSFFETSRLTKTRASCDNLGTQYEMNVCFANAASEVKFLPDRLISELQSHMREEEYALLLAAQGEWTKYRDTHCQWKANPLEGGSLLPTLYATCEIALTWERIDNLKQHLCESEWQPCDESRRYDDLQPRIQVVGEGDVASRVGDYARALTLYQQAIFDESLTSDSNERLRLSAYSLYRIVLLHVIQGHSSDAQTVYHTLQSQFPAGAVGHPYAELAKAFWDEYQSNQNVAASCGKAIDYASNHTDDVLSPLGDSGYAPEDICPFK